jgi:hypothetical protein
VQNRWLRLQPQNSPHSLDGNTVRENDEPKIPWPLHDTAIEYTLAAVSEYDTENAGDAPIAVGVAAVASVDDPATEIRATMLENDVLVLKLSHESLTVTVKVAAIPQVASVTAEPDAYEKLEHVGPGSTVVTTLGEACPALE